MISTPPDPFEAWFALPLGEESADPRFEVRQAHPDEFEQIYDVVDRAFGSKRSRALYDWQYRDNPFGLARAFIVVERATGAILKTGSAFPWPIWRGDEALMGELSGDAATRPDWQRKGLSKIRRDARRSHPWQGRAVMIAGPNEGSRVVSQKVGDGDQLIGALRGGVAPFRSCGVLERAGLPRSVAAPAGWLADGLLGGWQRAAQSVGGASDGHAIETIRRFTSDFDAVTLRCMGWPDFWCPHNADFLNWRYLDHPVESYVPIALSGADGPKGYAVVRLAGEEATLSEFAAGPAPSDGGAQLLSEAMGIAREAGCAYIKFFGTPSWRHWSLMRRAGFLPYATKNHIQALCDRFEPEIWDLDRWQLTPGDRDFQ